MHHNIMYNISNEQSMSIKNNIIQRTDVCFFVLFLSNKTHYNFHISDENIVFSGSYRSRWRIRIRFSIFTQNYRLCSSSSWKRTLNFSYHVSYIKRLFVGACVRVCVCVSVRNFLNCYKMANNGWILEFKVSKLPYRHAWQDRIIFKWRHHLHGCQKWN